MKSGFFYLCVSWTFLCLALLLSCGDAKDEAAVSRGKVMINGATASSAEISGLIERGDHIDVRWGNEFETNRGKFKYVYINGHRHIKWQLSDGGLDGFASIFEDAECPKCKRQREAYKREIIDSVMTLLKNSNCIR